MSVAATSAPSTIDDYQCIEQHFTDLMNVQDEDERRRRRSHIITTCMPLADHIAYRFAGRGEPSDDLVQVARLGLVKAVDRYQSDKGRFLAFAVPTIMGEVRRHFRDNTWTMRVPRRMKDTHRRVRDGIDSMSQRLGRAPTASELAADLGVDREEVMYSIEATYAYRPVSLDATMPGRDNSGEPLSSTRGSEDLRYNTIEDFLALSELMKELSDRERSILAMRFRDCLTQTEIARVLGISQVHVSRLLSMTLERLRNRLLNDAPVIVSVFMLSFLMI